MWAPGGRGGRRWWWDGRWDYGDPCSTEVIGEGACAGMPCGGGGDGGERSVALRADEADSAKGEGDQLELVDSFLSVADDGF